MRDPPTHLRFPLPPFSFSPPSLPLTSPALPLQLGQVVAVGRPVVLHRHRDGPEPAWSQGRGGWGGWGRSASYRWMLLTHTQSPRRWRSHRRWECSPCATMTTTPPPGSGRTRSSTVWCRPPPEGTGPDTPGPGRSWATPTSRRGHGCLTEGRRPAESPCRLCVEGRRTCCRMF